MSESCLYHMPRTQLQYDYTVYLPQSSHSSEARYVTKPSPQCNTTPWTILMDEGSQAQPLEVGFVTINALDT